MTPINLNRKGSMYVEIIKVHETSPASLFNSPDPASSLPDLSLVFPVLTDAHLINHPSSYQWPVDKLS